MVAEVVLVRLSIHEDLDAAIAFKGKIFLDGVEQVRVTEFDTDAGYLIRYMEVAGKPVLRDGECVTERLEGAVTIEEEVVHEPASSA